MSGNKKPQEDEEVGEEYKYDDDDFLEVEQLSEPKKEGPYEEKDWENEEESDVQGWEKEAKQNVNIEMIDDPSTKRRKTIYDLEAYAASGPTESDISKLGTVQAAVKRPREIRYSISMKTPSIARIDLSPLTQKIIGCVIDENVTTEYPWVYVRKQIIEDNIELYEETSDFLPIKDEIHAFPDDKTLIGYAPSLTEKAQFYVCLTVEARDTMVKHIQKEREDHENRVKNAVYKPIGQWHDLTSSVEIDAGVVKNLRPLFEIEMTTTGDLLNAPINLTDRKADDQRDGYIELLPYRQIFENVRRKLVSRATQVTPTMRHNYAQTGPSISVNSWLQYLYKYEIEDLSTYSSEKIDSLRDFLSRYTDEMCDQVLVNSTWDIYTNDYANLVRNEKDTQAPLPINYKEHQSYYDNKLFMNKVINTLCWHPLWTGIAIVTYAQHAKATYLRGPKTYDEVLIASEGDNRVLIWSFDDCLSPKLILECPREVTAISVCPLDGSVVVGGCANGQVVIWHIPGKIEQMEATTVQTSAQVKYKIAMSSLMTWMFETTETQLIRPTAMSSLKYSQKGDISRITWVSAYHKIDKNGRIISLPENTDLDDLSWQFITTSLDGTIAFWDLKWRPAEKDIRKTRDARKKKSRSRIETTRRAVSPFKILDHIFKPDYVLVIQYPGESRQPAITTLSIYNPKFRKEQVEPFPVVRDDITIRKYYKLISGKRNYVMEPKLLVGTVDGDFGCITWDGYKFATDVIVNRETARWLWLKRIHDGPVTHVVRSKYYHKVVVTVGGKFFVIWRDDFGEPLIWKKSNVVYTACSWGTTRPTVLILARMDGTIEIWDFIVKSHEPSFTQSLSGGIISGIYTHELPLYPQCIGICDFTGALRMFMAPRVLLTYDVADIEWMKKFIDRQVQKISEFKAWQKTWREKNLENIEMKKKLTEMEKKRLETEGKIKVDMVEQALVETAPTKPTTRKPWQFLEDAKARWMSIEVKRMQRVILEKKGLRKDVLEKQRAPVLKLQQEARTKKRKIREILDLQDKIFEETVLFLFPEQHHERKETFLPALTVSAADRRLTIDEFISEETALRKEVHRGTFDDPEQEIVYNFLEIQAEALAKLKSTSFEHKFNWRKILLQGKSRRQSMDVTLKNLNKPKRIYKMDAIINDTSRLVSNTA